MHKKLILAILVFTTMLLAIPAISSAASSAQSESSSAASTAKASDPIIWIFVNDDMQQYDQPAIILNNYTMVPLRAIFESLGATLIVKGNQITATKGTTVIKHTIGDTKAIVNGKTVSIGYKSVTINNRTLVPLRFVTEALQATAVWDSRTRTVTVHGLDYVKKQSALKEKLDAAILDGDTADVREILDAGANVRFDNGSSFATSVLTKNIETIKLFLERRPNINTITPYGPVINVAARSLKITSAGETMSDEATDLAIVKLLLKSKPQLGLVNSEGESILVRPIQENRVTIVQALMEGGAAINRPVGVPYIIIAVKQVNQDGSRISPEIVKLLLQYGADPNTCTCFEGKHVSALELAASILYYDKTTDGITAELSSNPDPVIIQILLDYGAELNTSNELIVAVLARSKEIVTMLLEAGADPNADNHYYDTPLELAKRLKLTEIEELLLRYMD